MAAYPLRFKHLLHTTPEILSHLILRLIVARLVGPIPARPGRRVRIGLNPAGTATRPLRNSRVVTSFLRVVIDTGATGARCLRENWYAQKCMSLCIES
jgi:hypothetical protein